MTRVALRDCTRLTSFIYGWIIARLTRKLTANTNSKLGRPRKTQSSSAVHVYSLSSDDEDAEIAVACSHAAAPSMSIPGGEVNALSDCRENNSAVSHPVSSLLAPVAQMFPIPMRSGNHDARSITNSLGEEAVEDSHGRHDRSNSHDATSESDYQPPQRVIKRRGPSTHDPSTSPNKRQKYLRQSTVSRATAASSQDEHSLQPRYNEEGEGSEAAAYPSPPVVESLESPETIQLVNFPNISRGPTARHQTATPRVIEPSLAVSTLSEPSMQSRNSSVTDANDRPTERPTERPIERPIERSIERPTERPIEQTSSAATVIARRDEDTDSVLGEAEVPHTVASSSNITPNATPRQSLVVPIKLPTQVQHSEETRKHLASNLVGIRSTGLRDPRILLLKSTIEILEELSRTSHLRLREIYNETFNHHQEALTHWIQMLKNIVLFYDVTGFKGDLSERDMFLEVTPANCLTVVEDTFINSSTHLTQWLRRRGIDDAKFVQEVASLLFHLGSWSIMRPARIHSMIAQFTRDLLAWHE